MIRMTVRCDQYVDLTAGMLANQVDDVVHGKALPGQARTAAVEQDVSHVAPVVERLRVLERQQDGVAEADLVHADASSHRLGRHLYHSIRSRGIGVWKLCAAAALAASGCPSRSRAKRFLRRRVCLGQSSSGFGIRYFALPNW